MLMLMATLLPVLAAVLCLRMEDDRKRHKLTVISVPAALVAAIGAGLSEKEITILKLSDTAALRFGADKLSIFFVLLVGIIWFVVQFHAFGYMKHEGNEKQFFVFFLLTYAALIALSFAQNAITLYMAFEFMTICSMPLVLHNGSEQSRKAALSYLGYSTLGASLALMGFFILAGEGNSLEFAVGGIELIGDKKRLLTAAFLILIGFGAKAGLVPLQLWLTEAHPVAPSPASAVLSGLITKGGIMAILRCVFFLFGASFLNDTWVQSTVMGLSVLTIFTGSMLALREKLLKRRLAYSTISNVSYVLFGLLTFEAYGIWGAFLQIVFHALAKSALFLCAGSVIFSTGKTRVDELRGIGRRMPATMWSFTIASLSLIGIPPMGGFYAKYCLAMGALREDSILSIAGLVVLMISALLTAFYLLSIVSTAFFPGRDFEIGEKCEVSATMMVPPIIFAGLTVVLGMFPGVLETLFGISLSIGEWLL